MAYFMNLDINKSFILYCNCTVKYDGRACSILEKDNYLIIKKDDNSIQIHGGDKIPARNYQGCGSKIQLNNDTIVVNNKKETLEIKVSEIKELAYLDNWSHNTISIRMTEKELVDKICNDPRNYLEITGAYELIREKNTAVGKIDIYIKDAVCEHIIEVKRKSINITNCTQIKRYVDNIPHSKGYIAGPSINENAKIYCDKLGLQFIKVEFD